MKKDRFKDFDDEVRNLVLDFENTVLRGESQFFDADEMEIIIDYYFEVDDRKPLSAAVDYALHLYPDSTELQLRRAHLLIADQQYGPALKLLNQLRSQEPHNTDIAYSLGVANGAIGMSEKAIAFFKEAAADGWMPGRVYSNIAEEYYKLKNLDEALHYYLLALHTDDCDETTLYNFYDTSYEANRLDEAASALNRFLRDNPYNPHAWFCLGSVYRDLSLFEKAIDAFEYAIAIDKSFVDAYVALSQTHDLMGHTPEAVTTMLRALEFSDDRARVFRTVGSLYAREANYPTAIAYFKKALDENPADAESMASLALALLETGDSTSARSLIRKALSIDAANPNPDMPDGNPDILCSAAMISDAQGDFQQASEYFEQMIVTGMYTEPQCQLYTQFLFNHHVWDIVIQFAEESLEVYPHSPFYSSYLAAAYFYTNRYNRARKMLPDVSPSLLADICPELLNHHLLGPLVPKEK